MMCVACGLAILIVIESRSMQLSTHKTQLENAGWRRP